MNLYRFRLEINNLQRVHAHVRVYEESWRERPNLFREDPSASFGYGNGDWDRILSLARATRDSSQQSSSSESNRELGELLFKALFQEDIAATFWNCYDMARQEAAVLHIELQFDDGLNDLALVSALPWEFLYASYPNKGSFRIAENPLLRFVRTRRRQYPLDTILLKPGEPLRIGLAVADFAIEKASSAGLGPVNFKSLERDLRRIAKASNQTIKLLPLARPANRANIDYLLEQYRPHIFHFIGHGKFEESPAERSGRIALVDQTGYPEWVSGQEFSECLNRSTPPLVVLQACEGGTSSESEAYAGIASQILSQGTAVVVAMQYEVTNNTATTFAREFYTRLANFEPVEKALQEGRRKIYNTISTQTRDFATPVLFTNLETQNLFARSMADNPAPESTASALPVATQSARFSLRNPFGDKGRIVDLNRFFDRETLTHQIFEELEKGCNVSLVGESQAGKSSLLSMVCEKGPARLGWPKEHFVYINMELLNNDKEFFEAMCEQFGLNGVNNALAIARAMKGKNFVLCLDEIEKMTYEGFTHQVRTQLRGLADGAGTPLRLVIASRSPLNALFPDSPERTSPLAGICTEIPVGPFSADAARNFLLQRLQGTQVTFRDSDIFELLTETQGYPARLQAAAKELFDRYARKD